MPASTAGSISTQGVADERRSGGRLLFVKAKAEEITSARLMKLLE